jgi:hypothetical protein
MTASNGTRTKTRTQWTVQQGEIKKPVIPIRKKTYNNEAERVRDPVCVPQCVYVYTYQSVRVVVPLYTCVRLCLCVSVSVCV